MLTWQEHLIVNTCICRLLWGDLDDTVIRNAQLACFIKCESLGSQKRDWNEQSRPASVCAYLFINKCTSVDPHNINCVIKTLKFKRYSCIKGQLTARATQALF